MRISLRIKMLLLSFIIVSISVLTSGWIMVYNISSAFETELGERAIAIARTVAQLPEMKNYVGKANGEEVIQPIAERIRLATNVDYIVIFDMNRIRYSHPSASKIGTLFEGGDERASLSEHEYISKAYGVLGYAVRAFVPIMDEEGVNQVGVAVVGLLTPTFQALLLQYQNDIFLSLIWGLMIGLLGSWLLANNIKKETFNLEPYEIAKLVEERSAVMQAMDMGIIAVDDTGKITFMNRLAQHYTGQQEGPQHHTLQNIFPDTWLTLLDDVDRDLVNRPLMSHGTIYLVSLYPIYVKEKLVGSLITMKDRSEANRLAEELTGVKTLVDALRAQNHEYMNKLHSIAGLIQLERTEEALEVMIDETTDEEDIVQFLRDHVTDYSVSGLLLGKRARAKELGVTLTIDRKSYLSQIVEGFSSGDVVTILGNLIENAIEACVGKADGRVVNCVIKGEESFLFIQVTDNGHGMSKEEQDKMFTYGFSTKEKEGRGIGLALVKQIIEAHQGRIEVHSKPKEGTIIKVEVKGRRGEQ
jgi:two-component system sensor histidine kinase DctS